MTLLATFLGGVAAVIAVAAYDKAATLEEDLRRPRAPVVDTSRDDALDESLRRLEARVAVLEERARYAPRADAPAATPAPSPPRFAEQDAGPAPVVEPAVPEGEKREEWVRRVSTTIDAYWKHWGAKYGLTESQIETLSSMQVDAAKHRLDAQRRLGAHEVTPAEGKADLDTAVEDVRRRARDLLTPEQFAQFEADKGAEWGASYRKVREAVARERNVDQ